MYFMNHHTGFVLGAKYDEKVIKSVKMDCAESMEVDAATPSKTTRSKERIDSISYDCEEDLNLLNEMILDYWDGVNERKLLFSSSLNT